MAENNTKTNGSDGKAAATNTAATAVSGLLSSVGKAGAAGGVSGNSLGLTNATNAVTGTAVKVKSGNIKVSDPQDWTAAVVILGVLALVLLKKV